MKRRNTDRPVPPARETVATLARVPQPHDGIGNALRTVFTPPALPDEWVSLLQKIA